MPTGFVYPDANEHLYLEHGDVRGERIVVVEPAAEVLLLLTQDEDTLAWEPRGIRFEPKLLQMSVILFDP